MTDRDDYPRCGGREGVSDPCDHLCSDTAWHAEDGYVDGICEKHGLVSFDWGCIDHSDLDPDE